MCANLICSHKCTCSVFSCSAARQNELCSADEGISVVSAEVSVLATSEEVHYLYMYIHEHSPEPAHFLRKSDCLGYAVLLCFVCLFDFARFFSFSSPIKTCT